MYEEADCPGPQREYDDENDDFIQLDNGARVSDRGGGAVGEDSVGLPCRRYLITELTEVTV